MFSRLRSALAGPRPTALILIFAVAALVLAATAASATDTQPPTPPAPVNATSVGQSSATINWGASSDNVAVLGYHLYKNGASMGLVPAATLSKTFAYLACGTTNTFGVSAYDTRYNTSAAQTISVSTSACGTGTPPVSDTTPPSNPTGLSTSGITSSAVTLTWAASTDNVAVSGYDVYLNGAKTATVGGTSYTFGGLPCNTSRPVGVIAHDAAGNNSAQVTITAQTAACGGSGGGGSGGSGGFGLATGLSPISTVTSSGVTRYFKTYKPAGLNDAAASNGVPLVLIFGGSPGSSCKSTGTLVALTNCDIGTSATSGTGQMFQSNWPAQANTQGAILLEPELSPASCASGGACNAEDSPNKQFVLDAIAYVKAHANVNVSKVYLYGFSAGASQAMGVANGENRSAGAKYVTSDWQGLASTFAAFAIQAGALGGNASSPTNQTAANTPVFTTTAKPVIYITSKDDPTIQVDDSNSTHTTYQCAVQTSGTCQLKASATNGYYAAHWGCTAPAKTTFSGHAFTSYDKWDFRCATSAAAYEWVSLGVDATHGPNHSYASYNSASDIPTLAYGWLAAHS